MKPLLSLLLTAQTLAVAFVIIAFTFALSVSAVSTTMGPCWCDFECLLR
jgi:hypothetical protein